MGKITWEAIYKEFRSKFPMLRKDVIDYRPYALLTIILRFKGKKTYTYEYGSSNLIEVTEQNIWH